MTAFEYIMRFTGLSLHAPSLVSTYRERLRRFIEGLAYSLRYEMSREVEKGTTFHQVVETFRRLDHFRG